VEAALSTMCLRVYSVFLRERKREVENYIFLRILLLFHETDLASMKPHLTDVT
jgi:hypothetical protein